MEERVVVDKEEAEEAGDEKATVAEEDKAMERAEETVVEKVVKMVASALCSRYLHQEYNHILPHKHPVECIYYYCLKNLNKI